MPRASTVSSPKMCGTLALSRKRLIGCQLLLSQRRIEQVAHLVALRREVADVVRVRRYLDRHAVDDLEAVPVEARAAQLAEHVEVADLDRVVRHQPHPPHAEVHEDLRADAVLPA